MVERLGEVRAVKVENLKAETVLPIIMDAVEKTAYISTDETHIYHNLKSLGYDHNFIKHAQEQYKEGSTCTNTIEGFWSQFKRMIGGTHIFVSKKYLQNYLDECCYRYNKRGMNGMMFIDLICQVASEEQ